MEEVDEKEIDKLIKLCRIECTEEEKLNLQTHLSKILKYVGELNEASLDRVEPCYRVLETLKNVMREDEVGETLSRELFLANAPAHVAGLIRVPPVIKAN